MVFPVSTTKSLTGKRWQLSLNYSDRYRLKIFKILSYRYRRFGKASNLIAGIYNYELAE